MLLSKRRHWSVLAILTLATLSQGCASGPEPAKVTLELRDAMTSTSYGTYKGGARVFTSGGKGSKKFDLQLEAMKVAFEAQNVAEKRVLSTGESHFEYCNLKGDQCVFYRRVEVALAADGTTIDDFEMWEGDDEASAEPVTWFLGTRSMALGDNMDIEVSNFVIRIVGAKSWPSSTCMYISVENVGGNNLKAYPDRWPVRTNDGLEFAPDTSTRQISLTSVGSSKIAELCYPAPANDIQELVIPAGTSVWYGLWNYAEEYTIAANWDQL